MKMRQFIKAAIILFIAIISQFFRAMQLRGCRFYPSCSQYSAQAFDRYGILKASGMTLSRVCRCHPFTAGGFDPVPEHGNSYSR